VAVDVGRGQLHQRLRDDPRVTVRERTNVRALTLADLGAGTEAFDLIVADLAFISLRTVASGLLGLAAPGADLVVLVKPQFEAGLAEANREKGVIRDPDVWATTLEQVLACFGQEGVAIAGLMVSPLTGAEGNVEFLAHLTKVTSSCVDPAGIEALVAHVVDEAVARGDGSA